MALMTPDEMRGRYLDVITGIGSMKSILCELGKIWEQMAELQEATRREAERIRVREYGYMIHLDGDTRIPRTLTKIVCSGCGREMKATGEGKNCVRQIGGTSFLGECGVGVRVHV